MGRKLEALNLLSSAPCKLGMVVMRYTFVDVFLT